jgi:poly-gamma-glutamate capsule biosynthesis protein CapA/YwtB (metallophosphatase superfamily)
MLINTFAHLNGALKPARGLFLILLLLNVHATVFAKEVITVAGVGDVMLGTDYPQDDLPPNQGQDLMTAVQHVLQEADLAFGNLEGAILNGGQSSKVGCKNCFAFRMPEYLAPLLPAAGFDVMSVANNHARDFGVEGFKNTERILGEMGIEYAGSEERPSVTFVKDGVRYGFAAFSANRGMADLRDIPAAQRIVRDLANNSDIVIVSFHGGAEGRSHQRVTRRMETFYGENRGNVYEFAHAVVDAGADIVFGHGPHVTRAVEVYQDRFIAYSLGNFCTYGPFNVSGPNGVAPIITVHVKPTGEFIKAQVTSTRQEKRGRVLLDESNQALKLLQKLTQTDFPEQKLIINDSGWIEQKR